MIIFDISAIAYGLLYQLSKDDDITLDLFRHAILTKIGYTIKDLKADFKKDEIIIACDNVTNWRKEEFPHYKASRKKSRDKQNIDWKEFFSIMSILYEEFDKNMPFDVIRVDYAEADDIIATMCKIHSKTHKKITIVSSDKDFRQLCVTYKGIVKLYSPIKNRYVPLDDYNLFEHILKGDSEDGIPNVLSEPSCFVDGNRQTVLSKKKRLCLLENENNLDNAEIITDEIKQRIEQNRTLIDLNKIPKNVEQDIIDKYNEVTGFRPRYNLFSYFVSKRLTKLMESGIYN